MQLQWYLRRQAGVISREQARDVGLSQDAVDRRVRSGQWERLHPGVYLSADREHTDQAALRAALLWAGPDATAYGVSAAWWHGLWPTLPTTVEITVPRRRRAGRRRGVRVRRRDLPDVDVVGIRDLWVTTEPLTVLEAAVTLGPDGPAMLDRALQRRVRFESVLQAHHRNLGRYGSAAASKLLVVAADRAASHAERLLVRLLHGAGITGWQLGYALHGYVIDLAFPSHRVAVEVDGWAWHRSVERFRRDHWRQNAIVNGGWTLLRFSWHDLDGCPDKVVFEIRTALAGAR